MRARVMGQVVEDIVEKKVEAKVFVDQWPSLSLTILRRDAMMSQNCFLYG